MLGFGRALGETMAVTMVIGNNPQVSLSLFAPQYTMAAVLANEFTEAADELYLDALIEIGLVLFVITLIVNCRLAAADLEHEPAGDGPHGVAGRGSAGRRRGMKHDAAAPARSRRWSSALRAGGAARAGAAGVHPVLRRHAGRAGAEPRFLHPACRRRSAKPGGGMANAIVGTLMLIGLGALFAVPIGVISGIYMAEFSGTRLATAVRFAADTLNGVPSIVIGVFVYGIAVLPFKQFSALAGGLALGVMMIPIITRTTEELLKLVRCRCAKARWRWARRAAARGVHVVLPAALPGIITGIVLALARIAGETAPLLFTAFNNRFFSTRRRSADLVADRPGLHLRHLALRGLASSGLGGRARAGGVGAAVLARWRDWRRAGSSACRPDTNADAARHATQPVADSPRTHGLVSVPPAKRGPADRVAADGDRRRAAVVLLRRRSRRCSTSRVKLPAKLVTAFIGPSGCGKSTFLRTLNRMNDIIPGARVDRARS